MCLIDNVIGWDAGAIRCVTQTHVQGDNPLRAQGRLGALCGIEYAAQAMAIHGAILHWGNAAPGDPCGPVQGYLAALRDVQSLVERLDDLAPELEIAAVRFAALAGGAIYDYEIRHATRTLQTGRLTLKFAGRVLDSEGAGA